MTQYELKDKLNEIEEIMSKAFLFNEGDTDKEIVRKEYKIKGGRVFEISVRRASRWGLFHTEDLLISLEIDALNEIIDYKLIVDEKVPNEIIEIVKNIY